MLTREQVKPTQKDIQNAGIEVDLLSDLDMAYDSETGDYTLFAVEFDGIFGKHWEYFKTEEERDERLKRYEQELLEAIVQVREDIKQEAIEKGRRVGEEKRRLREARTLGGQFPELAKLRESLRN